MAVAVNEDLREAAGGLGAVYTVLKWQGDIPLNRWAIPATLRGQPNLDERLLTALAVLYDEPQYARESRYLNMYRTITTKVREAALKAAAVTLDKQVRELINFDRRLGQAGVAERLHRIADNVRRRVDGFVPSGQDANNAAAVHGPPRADVYDPKYWRLVDESFRRRVKSALAAVLAESALEGPEAQEAIGLGKILSLHPKLVKILDYYAMSASLGDKLVHKLVAEAMAATAEFDATLRLNPERAWRYPPLITLGIVQLGLDDVYDFPEYLVDIGHVINRSWVEDAIGVLGLVILLVGVLLVGPLAVPGGALNVAVTGVALADLATTGAAAQLTYVREREQDIAAIGGGFSAARIAERSDFSNSALAGAATLLCGIAFVFSGAKLAKNWRARNPGAPPAMTPPPKTTTPGSRAPIDTKGVTSKGLGDRGIKSPGQERVASVSDAPAATKGAAAEPKSAKPNVRERETEVANASHGSVGMPRPAPENVKPSAPAQSNVDEVSGLVRQGPTSPAARGTEGRGIEASDPSAIAKETPAKQKPRADKADVENVLVQYKGGNRIVEKDGRYWHLPKDTPASKIPRADRMGDRLQEAAWDAAGEWNYSRLTPAELEQITKFRQSGDVNQANRMIGQARGRWVERQLREQFPELKWSGDGPDALDSKTQRYYEVHSGSLKNQDVHGERPGMTDVIWRTIFF